MASSSDYMIIYFTHISPALDQRVLPKMSTLRTSTLKMSTHKISTSQNVECQLLKFYIVTKCTAYLSYLITCIQCWNTTCQNAPQTESFDQYQLYFCMWGMEWCYARSGGNGCPWWFHDLLWLSGSDYCVWNTHTVITTTLELPVLFLWWLTQQSCTRLAYIM